MSELRQIAEQIVQALRLGDLDEAQQQLVELQRQIGGCDCHEERVAAAATVLEARRFARVHQAQTLQALQALTREGLYRSEALYRRAASDAAGTFQMEG